MLRSTIAAARGACLPGLLVLSGCTSAPATAMPDGATVSQGGPSSQCAQTTDGRGETARFSAIMSVAADARGVVYASDQAGIRRVAPDGTVTTLAPKPALQEVTGLAVGTDGDLYGIEYSQQRIVKIAPDGAVTVLAGAPYKNDDANANGLVDGVGAAARFASPWGLCVDGKGVVYVADSFNHRIRRVLPDGTVSTVAGSGAVGGSAGGYSDGPALSAQFKFPRDIAVDAAGTLYVVDGGNHRIRAISPDGTVSTLARYAGEHPLGDNTDVVLEPDGGVLFNEMNTIRRITPGGEVTTAFEGPETLPPGAWWQMTDLALLPDQRLLVADRSERLMMHPLGEGAWSLLAGSPRCPSRPM